ncbi:uncharacterized protein [Populus alba]|uniref:uncharacterized protein isoform X3 n=1 Tax=Populus alba TaxID=43335 RepID=UPI00158C2A5E|nr:DUF724 domain-containing protein 6-like isoform X3 [Populus alba]
MQDIGEFGDIMKFKKGSRVEVLRKTHLSSCAWRCGEIISGNGQTYWVRYDGLWGLNNEDDVESVSREVIRPCPPPVDVSDGWAVGDLVEVFDNLCWKTAAVMKVMRGNCYLVRLIGSSTELRVDKVNIRLRQLWQDGGWVEIGKGSGSFENEKLNKPSVFSCYQKKRSLMGQASKKRKVQARETCLAIEHNFGFQESCAMSARTSKRASPFWATHFESCNEKVDKMRAIEKQSEGRQVISGYPSSFLTKGHSWRHVNFASKGLKMMLGTCGSPSFFWLNECAGIMCRVLDELKAELCYGCHEEVILTPRLNHAQDLSGPSFLGTNACSLTDYNVVNC